MKNAKKNSPAQATQTPAKLSIEEFTKRAIVAARTGSYKGIHSVYSGFNSAFKEYFGLDTKGAIDAINALVAAGKIQTHFARGGVMLYLPGEMTQPKNKSASNLLSLVVGA